MVDGYFTYILPSIHVPLSLVQCLRIVTYQPFCSQSVICIVVFQRQSTSSETKPVSDRDRRAQEARARVAARVRSRQSSSPSPPAGHVAAVPLGAELIANAPPAVQAPESGVTETGKRAEWRQQKAQALEQQSDKAMDVIQRVKAMSASLPVGEDEVSRKCLVVCVHACVCAGAELDCCALILLFDWRS